MNNNLLYDITDKPRYFKEWIIYTIQMVLAVFVATVLIANICSTPDGTKMDISATLFGACVGTLIYEFMTKFKSPMFISSCGATVSAVCGALALNANGNYLMVVCGGFIILGVYSLMALLIKIRGINLINKFLPPTIVGGITIIIGMNLAKFLVTYLGQYGLWDTTQSFSTQCTTLLSKNNIWYVIIAIITMLITALVSHYGKGFIKNIPFLFGLLGGYILAIFATYVCHVTVWSNSLNEMRPLVDFSLFNNMQIISTPNFAFMHIKADQWSWANLGQTALYFVPVALAAICEHWADHRTLSNIVGTDLTKEPGMEKTLIGDGVASVAGTIICGLPNTSYGESIATIGFSKVASTFISTCAALCLGLLAFFPPVAIFISTIPSCVFGGCAMILYGYIAASGLKTIINSKVNLEKGKNLIILSVVLTVGVSGISFLVPAFGAVSLALVLGIILNLLLREKK